MTLQDKVQSKAGRVVAILVISAVGAMGLIGAGGYTVYANMRETDSARAAVDHSQAVLASLQTQWQRLDHVDLVLQLYTANNERSRLKVAENNLAAMEVAQLQIAEMVKDNESQSRHVHELDKALQELINVVNRMPDDGRLAPDKEVLDCRHDINILQQEETGLLRQRTDGSKQSSYRSFLLSLMYLGLSLMIVLVLFVFLFRDAERRRMDEGQLFRAKEELEATVHKLTERAEESELLMGARDELQLCTTAMQAHESTVRHMQQLLPGTSGATLTINNSRRMVEIAASWGEIVSLQDGFNPDACCGLRAGKQRWRRQGKSELHCAHFVGKAPENYLCVPLAAHGETLGFVYIAFETAEALAVAEMRAPQVQELVELASLSIASLNLRAKLEGQSIRDGLTGLFNRNFMEIALERELHRALRKGSQLAVLMLDVDHFKMLNDSMGHEAGDVVLREVADCYRRALREEDIICRYGGEEFVVIMPDATEELALIRAERIRAAVEEIRIHFRGELIRSVTVSVGVAMFPEAGTEGGELLRLADGALYRAKNGGRNQVRLESQAA